MAESSGAPIVSRDLLTRLPKAELHCHLDGSLRPATLLELARDQHVRLPRSSADELAEFMLVRDAGNLEDYLERFAITLSVMQNAESIERIAFELAVDAAAEGVRYLEVRFAPILNRRAGLTLSGAIHAAARGLLTAERDHAIVGRLIVCSLRNLDPEVSMELADVAVEHRSEGVVGFDLAGGEAGNPAAPHAPAFHYAAAHGLRCTCHAGEGDGAASIHGAVHECEAERVGHGTRLGEDPALLDYVRDRQITLEMCLTSNVQTRAARSYADHPFRQYYDAGLSVVLNTDNRLMSGVTLVDEYLHAHRELGFSFRELCDVALNGFRSAFLPEPEKSILMARARQEMDEMANGSVATRHRGNGPQ